jgi:hypothetical protein
LIFMLLALTLFLAFLCAISAKTVELNTFGEMQAEPEPWRAGLMQAMRASPSSGYVTLATVEKGRPRARTVLFSGLVTGSDGKLGITIKTSAESRKIQNADSDLVEIVWWLEDAYIQYRFSGSITYDGHESDRAKVWGHLNKAAKEQFYFPIDKSKGTELLDSSVQGPKFKEGTRAFQTAPHSSEPPESFKLGVLYPSEVDVLNLATLERANYNFENFEWDGDGGKGVGRWTEIKGFAPPVVSTTV